MEFKESARQDMVKVLAEEGFTRQQVEEMEWLKAWSLYAESIEDTVNKQLKNMRTFVKEHPQFKHILQPVIDSLGVGMLKALEAAKAIARRNKVDNNNG